MTFTEAYNLVFGNKRNKNNYHIATFANSIEFQGSADLARIIEHVFQIPTETCFDHLSPS